MRVYCYCVRITESTKKYVPRGNIDCNLCTKFKWKKKITNSNILEIAFVFFYLPPEHFFRRNFSPAVVVVVAVAVPVVGLEKED